MIRRILGGFAAAAVVAAAAVAVGVAPPAAALDNGLARTPYLGWNTYYGLGSSFDETTIESVADSIVSRGLKAAGYDYVWIDGGWWSGTRDAQGNITVDPSQWPHGMKAVADYIHSKGLRAGIYTDAGSDGCGGANQGSYGHYQQDADQFAAWGYDAVKVDFCGGTNLKLDPAVAYGQFRDALLHNASHRPMLFNICNPFTPDRLGPGDPPLERSAYYSYTFGPSTGNSWRTDTDVGFVHSIQWPDVLRNLDDDAAHPEAAGPGHWNDPDYLGPELGMTAAESQAQFTMWSMVAAPLMIGSDVRALSPATIAMLTNRDVLAVDQDRLGVQGTRISKQGNGDVWVKPLANGDRAVALLNRGSTPLTIRTSTDATGLPHSSQYKLHDLWTGKTTETAGGITTTVPPQSAVLYRVSQGAADVEPATDLSAPAVPATPGSDQNLVLPGAPLDVSATFRNDGREPVSNLRVTLAAPTGWTVTGGAERPVVPTGGSVTARWRVTPPAGTLPGDHLLSARAGYRWHGGTTNRDGDVDVLVPPAPPDGTAYLSDHSWLQASSGWQVAAPDQSVGGGPITMQRTQYPKGLGVASVSRVDYFLGGSCTRLTGVVGIDDAVNNVGPEGGTSTFTIAGDGTSRYDSGLVDRSATKSFDVDLTGVRRAEPAGGRRRRRWLQRPRRLGRSATDLRATRDGCVAAVRSARDADRDRHERARRLSALPRLWTVCSRRSGTTSSLRRRHCRRRSRSTWAPPDRRRPYLPTATGRQHDGHDHGLPGRGERRRHDVHVGCERFVGRRRIAQVGVVRRPAGALRTTGGERRRRRLRLGGRGRDRGQRLAVAALSPFAAMTSRYHEAESLGRRSRVS